MRKLVAFVPLDVAPLGVTLLSRKMKASGERPPLSAETTSGNSLTCLSVTLSCCTGLSVCSTGASDETVTLSLMLPSSSVTSA